MYVRATDWGLVMRGSMTSVSWTPFGTVSIIRASKLAQVCENTSGLVKLWGECQCGVNETENNLLTLTWSGYYRLKKCVYRSW